MEKKLEQFKQYYNESRAHSALNARTPTEKAEGLSKKIIPIGSYGWNHHASGQLQLPIAALLRFRTPQVMEQLSQCADTRSIARIALMGNFPESVRKPATKSL